MSPSQNIIIPLNVFLVTIVAYKLLEQLKNNELCEKACDSSWHMFYRVIVCYLCLQKNALAFKEIGRRMVVTGRGKADFRRTPAEGMKKRIEGMYK